MADSNHRLQRTLYWLALSALGIAVIGLLVGFITDDAQNIVAERMYRLLSDFSSK